MKHRAFLLALSAIILLLALSGAAAASSTQGTRDTQVQVFQPSLLNNYFDDGPHLPLGYGPYRDGQSPGGARPSTAEMEADMKLIRQETRLIRTYGACGAPGEIPPLAGQYEIFVDQGAALSDGAAANAAEMSCYRRLLTANPNILRGVIGNETLLRGDLSEAALIGYLDQARSAGDAPVSTAETWGVWCNLQTQNPRCPGRPQLAESVDFITAHVHPYWESLSIEHAAAHVMAVYIALRSLYPDKEIVIGEAGWPSCGEAHGYAVPGVENQRRFIEELWKWSNLYDAPVFAFEAFDEAWKTAAEGQAGGCWGLYDADRAFKHPGLDWTVPTPAPAPSSPAIHIEHPQGATTTVTQNNCAIPLFGRVYNAQPGWRVKVEVFTNAWYLQDRWYTGGLAPVVDGMWSMPEVVLAGQGTYNNHRIRATLVDQSGTPVASQEVSGIVRSNGCTP